MAVAVLVPATPALAHRRLPVGKYYCYDPNLNYTYNDLYVRTERRYAYKTGDELIGKGRFKHPSDTNKIRFTSGYLFNRDYKAAHYVNDDSYQITLRKYTNGGWAYTYCYKSR